MERFINYTDEQLVKLIKQDDESAFEALYNRYWERMYAAACKRLTSPAAAEEIVQDFFTSLWTRRDGLDIRTSFEAYVFTSVRYLVLHHIQKEYVRNHYKTRSRKEWHADNSTEELVFFNDLKQHIGAAVAHLPYKCRVVYERSREDYKTNKEIAREMGISEKTVENHLTKALKKIRLSLGHTDRSGK